MVTGGKRAKPRTVLTLSIAGGALVASVALVGPRCVTTGTPPVSPEPAPPAPSAEPSAEAGTNDAAEPPSECSYYSVRARGLKRKRPRIVGGTPAAAGAFPFTVGIATPDRFQYCAGSLVRERFVVTAAHCMVEPGDLALVGSNALDKARAVRVKESRHHPMYDDRIFDYDVGVVVLEQDAEVAAVPLAERALSHDAVAVGWGLTAEGGSSTNFLREAALPLWEHADCKLSYPSLTGRQLCAGEEGRDACQGDSGGPLVAWNVDHWALLGITSFGRGCARPDFPGVFTDVRSAEIRQWIDECAK